MSIPFVNIVQKYATNIILKCVALAYLLVTNFISSAQAIRGQVVDSQTNLPIDYAHIRIENTHLGTITNEEGKFSLVIPGDSSNASIIVTHVGYEKVIISPKNATPYLNIQLRPAITSLQEITVSGLDPFEIIKNSNKRKKANYPYHPSRLTGFYRHGIKINGVYTQFLEASLEIILPYYGLITNPKKFHREIYVNELRLFENVNFYSVSPYRMFDDLFFIPVTERNYDAEIILEKTNSQEFAIKATPKDLTTGLPEFELIIDKESFAFKDIVYQIPKEFWQMQHFKERAVKTLEIDRIIKEKRTFATIHYSFYHDRNTWYLKQVRQLSKFTILDGSESKDVVYFIEYATQNITEVFSDLGKSKLLRPDQNMYHLKTKKNASRFKRFPMIEPSPEQLELIQLMEREENED